MSTLPDDNPKTAFGSLKPSMSLIPGPALVAEAVVFALGAEKYGAYNWREKSISSRTYVDACERHIRAWFDGEDIDAESGQSHLAHARACLGMLLDALATGNLNDNRPPPAPTADLIRQHTAKA